MTHIIATNSCHRQQLIRVANINILQPMVANSKNDFAIRLNQACSDASPTIPEGRGRRAELRRRVAAVGLDVSGESVRKWLSGESIPSMDNIRYIAIALAKEADWLLTGRDSTYAPQAAPNVQEERAPYRLPADISAQGMAVGRYYDRLPALQKAEMEAAIVQISLELPVEYRTQMAEILNLFQ